ncbi:MAG TPA: hypothetical protein VKV21_16070 [Solirubrobacteraceae bacterium]|nr:hypothetical protein [Solirubrobacteraceae bacterium]
MAVALVLDFPGGTREQYDEVVERMRLGGHMAPGGQVHIAGPHADGWRVIDVWDGLEQFERFRDEQIIPHAQAAGLSAPQVRALEVDDAMPDDGRSPRFAQCVVLPGLDRPAFRALHEEVVPGGARPDGLTFHVNGPCEGGWCVIDGWVSQEIRDRFMERTRAILERAPLSGPPTIEELEVERSMAGAAATHA